VWLKPFWFVLIVYDLRVHRGELLSIPCAGAVPREKLHRRKLLVSMCEGHGIGKLIRHHRSKVIAGGLQRVQRVKRATRDLT